jgi:phosphate transport system permease protein
VINAAAAIIVLLVLVFILNGIAVFIRYRYQRKMKW